MTSAEIAALRAENERLRFALQVILDCPNPDSVSGCHDAMWQIAKEALDA